jgi:hypothetical protein
LGLLGDVLQLAAMAVLGAELLQLPLLLMRSVCAALGGRDTTVSYKRK